MADLMQTPLHLAAKNGYHQCVDLLLEYKGDRYKQDLHKNTPHGYIKDTQYYKKKLTEKKKERKQEMLEAMYKAREDGYAIKVRYGKILLCGANGAGKTNLLNLIMKEKFNPNHVSTEVAKPHQATVVIKAQMIKHNDEVIFKIMNIDDEIDHLMLYLPKNFIRPLSQKKSDHNADSEHSKNQESGATLNKKCHTIAETIISGKLVSNKPKIQPPNEQPPEEQPPNEQPPEEQPPDKPWDIFTFIDTGGQPQFISMLPVVNVSAMITFIVHKMIKDGKVGLDHKFEVKHGNKKGKSSFRKHNYECTYLQLIKTLISHASVNLLPDERFDDYKLPDCRHSDSHSKKSISFIGTHSQDISESKINEIDEVLNEAIDYNNNACLENIKRDLNEHYTYLIPVDNKMQNTSSSTHHGNSKKFTDVSKIRSYIYKCIQEQDVYKVPIQWLLLDLEIRKKCKNEEINFITYNDVLQLAKEKSLGEGNFIQSALRFHHLHGVLLYFEDVEGMCDLVITNHQWLFEKLTEIVHYSFTSDKTKEFEDLKKGMFNETMLNELNIDEDFKKCRVVNPKKSFLQLLQHLLIIAPLKEDVTKYFMPSLLDSYDLSYLQEVIPGDSCFKTLPNDSEPLLIQFEFANKINGFPRGFFCFLTVQLIHAEHWDLYKKNAKQNLITFHMNDHDAYYVTLIDKIFFLEVHVTHESSDMAPIHHEVFTTIKRSLNEVGERLNVIIKIKVGFLCKKCQDTTEEHITYLQENASEHKYCSCIAQEKTRLERSHEVWLSAHVMDTEVVPNPSTSEDGYSSTASPIQQATSTVTNSKRGDQVSRAPDIFETQLRKLSPKPTFTELIQLLNGVVSWKTLAAHLLSDTDGSKVETIEKNNCTIQDCRAEMLREYFKSGTVSWEVVIQSLIKAGENNTADKIQQMLL